VRTVVQQLGDAAEGAVVARLEASGWAVLGRQLRVGRAELDIVAVDPGPPRQLVVVEVRWRGRRDFGLPEETVDRRKRTRVHQAAFRWLTENRPALSRLPIRFDLIVAEPGQGSGTPVIRHHRAAF
jgi:putative endonuclease